MHAVLHLPGLASVADRGEEFGERRSQRAEVEMFFDVPASLKELQASEMYSNIRRRCLDLILLLISIGYAVGRRGAGYSSRKIFFGWIQNP